MMSRFFLGGLGRRAEGGPRAPPTSCAAPCARHWLNPSRFGVTIDLHVQPHNPTTPQPPQLLHNSLSRPSSPSFSCGRLSRCSGKPNNRRTASDHHRRQLRQPPVDRLPGLVQQRRPDPWQHRGLAVVLRQRPRRAVPDHYRLHRPWYGLAGRRGQLLQRLLRDHHGLLNHHTTNRPHGVGWSDYRPRPQRSLSPPTAGRGLLRAYLSSRPLPSPAHQQSLC